MTRSIEATAARVRHVTVNEAKTTVAWCLPASKTDTKALSATRTHRCHCGADQSSAQAHRNKNCPYHVMYDNIQLIAKVFSMNLQDEAFLDMPLFPSLRQHAWDDSLPEGKATRWPRWLNKARDNKIDGNMKVFTVVYTAAAWRVATLMRDGQAWHKAAA